MRTRRGLVLATVLAVVCARGTIRAQDEPPPETSAPADNEAAGPTPPRLSFTDGEVSFWRPGAEDWGPARTNTPLAAGDSVYAGDDANFEVQIGPQAFARAGADTELGIEALEPNFLQLKATGGHVSLDLRRLTRGQTVEVDTPNSVVNIDRSGYYRLDVDKDTTTLVTRRGGRATVTPAGGEALDVAPSEQVVAEGTDSPEVKTYAAPDLDDWDRWNYDRTDHLIDPESSRYVPPNVYGADDLDHHGRWREVPKYGNVWVPNDVPADWAPYSTGRWIYDPYYGWSWVDDAPWGWAPYHYGRWVYVGGYWGWAPGPIVAAPVYSPALVAFFGAPGVSVSVGFGAPSVGWVALGWGEPVIPWWGPTAFVGVPHWCGWGGPHVVNNVVINRTTIINANNVTVLQNAHVHNAIIASRRDRFGTGADHFRVADAGKWKPIREPLRVKPSAASLVPAQGRTVRPPESVHARPVVATRAPHDPSARLREAGLNPRRGVEVQQPRIVAAPPRGRGGFQGHRPPPGAGEARNTTMPAPPRFEQGEHARHGGTGNVGGRPVPPASARPARPQGGQPGGARAERGGAHGGRPAGGPPSNSQVQAEPGGRGPHAGGGRGPERTASPGRAQGGERPPHPTGGARYDRGSAPAYPRQPEVSPHTGQGPRPSFGGGHGLPGEPANRVRPSPRHEQRGSPGASFTPQRYEMRSQRYESRPQPREARSRHRPNG